MSTAAEGPAELGGGGLKGPRFPAPLPLPFFSPPAPPLPPPLPICSYKHEHEEEIATTAVAQMLGNTLYGRRFFPYYAFNVLAGIDGDGRGAVYTYDAVGSFERVGYACQGSGQKLIIPYLDNVIGYRSRGDAAAAPITADEAVNVAKDAFITAAERQIYVGDSIRIYTLVHGVKVAETTFALKRD